MAESLNAPGRVLFITTGLDVGGAESMLVNLLGRLDRTRFQPSVLSLHGDGHHADALRKADIDVIRLRRRVSVRSPCSWREAFEKATHQKPELIQGWMYHGNFLASLVACRRASAAKLVWGIRCSLDALDSLPLSTRLLIRLSGQMAKSADAILFNSGLAAEQHQRVLRYPHGRCRTIPNGFDTDKFRPMPDGRARERARLGLPESAQLIGMVGRWDAMKDHRTFLDAAAELGRHDGAVRFVLAGPGITGENAELTAMIAERRLTHQVILAGPTANPQELMNAMDVFTLTSVAEGFPNVVGEAMACGIPVVTSDAGDCAMLVGEVGVVVPPRSPKLLANEWHKLLVSGPENLQAIGRRSRERVESEFSIGAIVKRYEALYAELLGQKGSV